MTDERKEWGILLGDRVVFLSYRGFKLLDTMRSYTLYHEIEWGTGEPEQNPSTAQGLTRSEFRKVVGHFILGDLWNHADKVEAFHLRHSEQWNADSIAIARAILFSRLDPQIDAGRVSVKQLHDQIGDATSGWIQRVIAGADWLAGEAGQRSLNSAVAAEVGTAEEVRAILVNRIAAMDEPIAIDYFMDKVPPSITVTQTPQAEYYASLPGFVHPSEQEQPTSVFLRYSVMDESSVSLELHVGLSYVALESLSGERWLRDGNAVSLRATDAQGNVAVKTFRNEAGIVSESEEVLAEVE